MGQQPEPRRHRGIIVGTGLAAVLLAGLAGCAHRDRGRYASNTPLVAGTIVTVPIDAKLRGKPDWIGVVKTVLPQGSTVRLEVVSADGRYWQVQTQEGGGWLSADDLQWVAQPR